MYCLANKEKLQRHSDEHVSQESYTFGDKDVFNRGDHCSRPLESRPISNSPRAQLMLMAM